MPKLEYFSDEKYAYSTALMFAYINICKPEKIKLQVKELEFNLDLNCWDDNLRPIDVINDFNNKKYKKEVDRIKNSNTTDKQLIGGINITPIQKKYLLSFLRTLNDFKLLGDTLVSEPSYKSLTENHK
jgi:hypothetical protein